MYITFTYMLICVSFSIHSGPDGRAESVCCLRAGPYAEEHVTAGLTLTKSICRECAVIEPRDFRR